ncbi:MAG: hypothetical protein HKN11_18820 [Rhizobiales bacterium]|nr:hypothetical protein [Hyphomicrobiales bacterium]
MKRVAFVAILAVPIYLTGPELYRSEDAHAQSRLPAYQLFWRDQNLNEVVKDKDTLEKLIREMFSGQEDSGTTPPVTEIIQDLKGKIGKGRSAFGDDDGDGYVPGQILWGFNGIAARQVINVADRIFNGTGEICEVKIEGDIAGYYFSHDNFTGFLAVKTHSYNQCPNDVPTNIKNHEWFIFVSPGTYSVHTKGGDPANPFPGTMELPDDVVTELDGGAMDHLTHKLFAKGEGIEILAVYENGTLLDRTNELYEIDANSCIDMFFDRFPPETNPPAWPNHCLGRCETPRIVATM